MMNGREGKEEEQRRRQQTTKSNNQPTNHTASHTPCTWSVYTVNKRCIGVRAMLICDENGNSISKLDYGKVYYSSAYITYQLLTLINDTNETLILTTDCFTAEEYPASIKLIEINNLNDCEVDCIRMLLELPQFDLMIPPMSKIHVRAYLVFNFTSEDLFAYSDHKRVGGTSYFRISMTLVFKSKTLSHNIDSILTIHASACNSLLSADDTEIEFDSCLVGNTYVRDVQIWNRSECVLLYRIMPHGGKTSGKLPVSFSDFETGKVINLYEQLSIPAFSSQRLRITLKAKVSLSFHLSSYHPL